MPALSTSIWLTMIRGQREVYQNVIIDEMSMVDLLKFEKVLRRIKYTAAGFRRLILIGDRNQLPPIGFG